MSRHSRFRFVDSLTEATSAVGQRPARTLLTALGTILGVGAFVATTGLADTARAQVSARFDALKATEVRVQDAIPDGTNPFPSDVDRRLQALNGVRSAGLIYQVGDTASLQPRSTATRPIGSYRGPPVVAATPGALAASRARVAVGRLYDQFHEGRAERVALVGRSAAEQLGISRIDNQPAVFVGDLSYAVIGILDDSVRSPELLLAVVIPTSSERRFIRSDQPDYEVLIEAEPGAASLAGRQAPLALRPQEPERLQVLVPPDPTTLRNDVESDVTGLYYALAGLALLIGMIAIANATLLSTIERRPEIGLRRALGATRLHIVRQVTLEAAITGAVAGVAGTVAAVYVIAAVAQHREWVATIDPVSTLLSPLIGLVAGLVAGVVPALKAARTPPATTLRA